MREPLRDGDEIASLPTAEIGDGDTLDVPFGFDVAFEQVGGVRRQPATQLLAEIVGYVDRLIESFRGDFK